MHIRPTRKRETAKRNRRIDSTSSPATGGATSLTASTGTSYDARTRGGGLDRRRLAGGAEPGHRLRALSVPEGQPQRCRPGLAGSAHDSLVGRPDGAAAGTLATRRPPGTYGGLGRLVPAPPAVIALAEAGSRARARAPLPSRRDCRLGACLVRERDVPRLPLARARAALRGGALRWKGQTARATRGRDLQLNVPFPRKPPDLLMAESPPEGGLSALTGPRSNRRARRPPAITRRPPSSMLDSNPANGREARSGTHLSRTARAVRRSLRRAVDHGLNGRRRIRAGCRLASP
jgi:hypothetical protein